MYVLIPRFAALITNCIMMMRRRLSYMWCLFVMRLLCHGRQQQHQQQWPYIQNNVVVKVVVVCVGVVVVCAIVVVVVDRRSREAQGAGGFTPLARGVPGAVRRAGTLRQCVLDRLMLTTTEVGCDEREMLLLTTTEVGCNERERSRQVVANYHGGWLR